MTRSARFPASSDPIVFPARRSCAADRRHLQRLAAGTAVGSLVTSFCRNAACRIASNMSRSLLLAAPSVPSPTVMPAARYSGTGAMPLASFMLLSGLCDTATLTALEDRDVLRRGPTPCAPPASGAPRNRSTPDTPRASAAMGRPASSCTLRPRLRHVDDDGTPIVGQRAARFKRFRVDRVRRVRGNGRHDQLVVFNSLMNASPAPALPLVSWRRRPETGSPSARAPRAGRPPWWPGRSPLRSITCPHMRWCPIESFRAPPVAFRCGPSRVRPSWPRRERCTSPAIPGAADRQRGRGRAPSGRACGC